GVAIVSDAATITCREPLCALSLAHRLATVFSNRKYLKTSSGGLLSHGPDLEGAFHRAAFYVDRILRGAKPQDLPIEQASTFELVINQRTAHTLGLAFPPSMRMRADAVIG